MNLAEFKARIKAAKPEGWYIFAGEEDYLKNFYLSELRKTTVGADDGLAIFNHTVLDAQDFDLGALAEAIQSPPMMQEYKLIEWRFADLGALKESELKAFRSEIFPLKAEYPAAVLAITATAAGFDAGSEKRPSRLAKLFGEAFDIISFPRSTDNQLLGWLKKHFDAEGIGVTLDALNAMLFRVGRSMEALGGEVAKLSAFLKANGRNALTASDVELVCSASAESDAFAIQNAVMERNASKAFRALADMKARRTDPQMVIGMLAKTYSTLTSVALLAEEGTGAEDIRALLGLSPYPLQLYMRAAKALGSKRISAALTALLEADAAAKQGGIGGYRAIELFVAQNI